jgi:hypothetical protein
MSIMIELPVLQDCSTIQLYKGQNKKPFINTLIDADNFCVLNKHRWLAVRDPVTRDIYAVRYEMNDGTLRLIHMANEVRRLAGLSMFKDVKKKKRVKTKRKRKGR